MQHHVMVSKRYLFVDSIRSFQYMVHSRNLVEIFQLEEGVLNVLIVPVPLKKIGAPFQNQLQHFRFIAVN